MSAILTRDQADLLERYGWQTADMLLNPDAGISAAKASSSCAVTDTWSWETTSKGIAACRGRHPRVDPRNGPDVIVTWSLLRSAAKAVPDQLLSELRAARQWTQREWVRHFPEFAPWAPGGRAAWVDPPPEWHRDAQAAQRRVMVACLDVLSGAPVVRTHVGPNPPHRPNSVDTWLWSRCWTCGWYTAHLEERHAMEHTIEAGEHRCDAAESAEPEQLDLFGDLP